MKKLFGLLSTCFILLAIVSCSNLNESSSLSLTFNGSDFARNSSARNISVSSDYDGYYLVVNLLGDYKETKTIPFSSIGTYTITFDYIPVGAEIYVEANAYFPNSERFTHLYKGKSEKTRVHSGQNTINLKMSDLISSINANDTPSLSAIRGTAKYNGTDVESITGQFYALPNGKYVLINSDNTIYSEATWRGSTEEGGTFYYTECLYKSFTLQSVQFYYTASNPTNVIIEEPEERSITVSQLNFNFVSGNGLVYGLNIQN